MDEWILDWLRSLGIPAVTLVGVVVVTVLVQQAWSLMRTQRLAASELVLKHRLDELNQQLTEFYLPLRERFALTHRLFRTSTVFKNEGAYENDLVVQGPKSGTALRHILVRRVFLPLNAEVESTILNKSRFRDAGDETDYTVLAQHFVLWRALEESVIQGEIEKYDGTGLLEFPAEEAEKFSAACDAVVRRREFIYEQLASLRHAGEHLFGRRRITEESRQSNVSDLGKRENIAGGKSDAESRRPTEGEDGKRRQLQLPEAHCD